MCLETASDFYGDDATAKTRRSEIALPQGRISQRIVPRVAPLIHHD
jgi:hypothetical protein